MGTERGGCSRLMKTPRHNGGAVHSRSVRAKKKDNHCSGPVICGWDIHSHVHNCPPLVDNTAGEHSKRGEHRCY